MQSAMLTDSPAALSGPQNVFPNPFFDAASAYVPTDLNAMFEWSEYLWLANGTYRAAARRVVRYFLTELVVDCDSDVSRVNWEIMLEDKLHILRTLADIGDDYMVYGNVFVSVYMPFVRMLSCPAKGCGIEFAADKVQYTYKARPEPQFIMTCPKCGYAGVFNAEDRRSMDADEVGIIRWNPKRIKLRHHVISDTTEYLYELEPRDVRRIEEGRRFYIDKTPMDMLRVVSAASGGSPALYAFAKDAVFHLKEATLAGLPIRGWAMPTLLPVFKLAYYIQMLRRADEAIAMDFIVPYRFLTPRGSTAGASGMPDALSTISMETFAARMRGLVERHRKDPTSIQVAPYGVDYVSVGAEGAGLMPKDSIAYSTDEMLNAIGYPAELYRGTLQLQAFPVALRLFEKTWGSLVDGYNDILVWMGRRIRRHFDWDRASVSLRSVTLADDIERKALQLQAAAGMDLSKTTVYRAMDVDFMEEQKRVVEEQKEIQKLQREAIEEEEARQLGGEAPQQDGGGVGATPGDVRDHARELAYALVVQTPETLRRGELIKIKNSNPTLHALVIQEMDTLRQDMARQGQAVMIEQAKTAMIKLGGGIAPINADALPSAAMLSLRIASEIMDYSRADLRKLAARADRPGGREAFHYIYSKIRGWDKP